MSPGAKFRQALAAERPLQVIGAIVAYHALLAKRTGYQAIYLSGGGVAAGSLGMPDLGISNLDDVLIDIRRITCPHLRPFNRRRKLRNRHTKPYTQRARAAGQHNAPLRIGPGCCLGAPAIDGIFKVATFPRNKCHDHILPQSQFTTFCR